MSSCAEKGAGLILYFLSYTLYLGVQNKLFINCKWKHYSLSCDRYLGLSKRIRRMESSTRVHLRDFSTVSFVTLSKIICYLKDISKHKYVLEYK